MSLSNTQVTQTNTLICPFNQGVGLEYDYVYINTSTPNSPSTLILPNIQTSGFLTIAKRYIIVDISNNASSSPITIQCNGGDLINNTSSIVMNTNGVSVLIEVCSSNQWIGVFSTNTGGGGGSGYDQVQNAGIDLPQRTTLDFTGAGVTASDNGVKTLVTINGASAPIVNILYANFYTDITNGDLVAGTTYRITDYQSGNYLNGYSIAVALPSPSTNFNPTEVYTSPNIEVLQVKAISNFQIEPFAVSESFPEDEIVYNPYVNSVNAKQDIPSGVIDLQWDGTNVYFDAVNGFPISFGEFLSIQANFNLGADNVNISFENPLPTIANVPTSDLGTISTNATINAIGTKVILNDLTLIDFGNYVFGSLSLQQSFGNGSTAKGMIVKRIDTINNISFPCDWRNRVYRRFEVDLTSIGNTFSYWSIGTSIFGISATNTYQDFPMVGLVANAYNLIVEGSYTTQYATQSGDNFVFNNSAFLDNYFDAQCFDNTFLGTANYNNISSRFSNNAVGNGFERNQIDDYFNANSVASTFSYNKIGTTCYNNFFGNTFAQNVIDSNFRDNIFGINCTENSFGTEANSNIIGDAFIDNVITNNFKNNVINNDFVKNTIGQNFNNNSIGLNFESNTIAQNFDSNFIADDFQFNNIGYQFSDNGRLATPIGNGFTQNTIASNFLNNAIIGGGFALNSIGNGFEDNTIGLNFKNNQIGNTFATNTIGNSFQDNRIGNGFANNLILLDARKNIIGDTFADNEIGNDFRHNNIGDAFSSNAIGDTFENNNIGNAFINNGIKSITLLEQFANNIIGNNFNLNATISANFSYNFVRDNFGQNIMGENVTKNNFGLNFLGNQIGKNSNNNTFGNDIDSIITADGFINNEMADNTFALPLSYIDYSNATYVYGQYTCNIIIADDNTTWIGFLRSAISTYAYNTPSNA